MQQFIESLCRLYSDGKISDVTLNKLLASHSISEQDYLLIISAKNAIGEVV